MTAASLWAAATRTAPRRAGTTAALVAVAWAVAAAVLPNGLPLGIVLLGLVLGSLASLTAMGLVLIYRSNRIINFAQAEIGGLAASVAVIVVVGLELSYWIALPVGLLAAAITGALIDLVVVRRFFRAPRLILTVATIGLAQILAGTEIQLPRLFDQVKPLSTFTTPFTAHITVGPIVFNGDHLVAVVVVPVVLLGLAWFLGRSDAGIAVRGAAESGERALLLGIPVRRLSTITWIIAASLSGVGAMLSAPILGANLGALAGPEILLPPLAAAVLARMESLPVALGASLGIGVFQQAVFWNYPRASTVDVGLFGLVLVGLLLQRRRRLRIDDADLGGYVAVREVRPVPAALARLPVVRRARAAMAMVALAVVIGLPLLLTDAKITLASFMAIYGIMAVSLVILTGWAGQISLGQFAFAGVGAAATGSLVVHARLDLFVALLVAAAVGALTAALIGLPAVRIRGLMLAATTLAFAVPVNTYLLNSAYFPKITPRRVDRPPLLNRFDINRPLTFYYFCLIALAVSLVLARNFRRSRIGRAVIAVRDNERGAAAYGISPVRAKLTAFVLSGALAGFAGGLYVLGVRGIGFAGFAPVNSMVIFTMVVVGGLGSLTGALAGAIYVQSVQYFLHRGAQLLATGGGLLVLLMIVPGGLGEIGYAMRDWWLRTVARRRGLEVPSLLRTTEPAEAATPEPHDAASEPATALLRCVGIDAAYGQVQVLFGADLAVDEGGIMALLGTNGAGKSTLLRVIAGLLPAQRGRVIVDGVDVTDLDPVARLRLGIVMVPGGRGVFQSLSVAENLRLAGWLWRRRRGELAPRMARVFELFPVLRERLAERAGSLSGGEQQMLTISQALLCEPRVLMIDELSLGLSPLLVSVLLEVVRELNAAGTTIVVVEQSVNVASSIARRAAFMEKGQVRFEGDMADLISRPDLLRAVFLRGGARRSGSRPPARSVNGRRAQADRPDEEARLELIEVSKRFGGVSAVDGVELRFGADCIVGLIGANGAGKTTLLDLCSGYLTPDAGRVHLDHLDVTELGPDVRAALGLGRSFQDARLFPSLTVVEAVATAFDRHLEVREPVACTLRVGAAVASEREVAERVDELLAEMGLERYRDSFIAELSTGTRRIVDLACAVAHGPGVLLLDEPSSGIAQREGEALAKVLIDLKRRTGATLVIVEHDIPLVSSIADELVCLHLGQVIAQGPPADVLNDPAVIGAYLGTDAATIQRSGTRRRKTRVPASA